jgi:hypothetical protein
VQGDPESIAVGRVGGSPDVGVDLGVVGARASSSTRARLPVRQAVPPALVSSLYGDLDPGAVACLGVPRGDEVGELEAGVSPR